MHFYDYLDFNLAFVQLCIKIILLKTFIFVSFAPNHNIYAVMNTSCVEFLSNFNHFFTYYYQNL